ncbi:MAG: hypothetical protein OEW60_02635 [Thiovulaceae bacterium]|nr:hypothetical protein [Sulfurimonadaceae bacterium]
MRTRRYTVVALEDGWEWEDFNNIDILEYCTQELSIPNEFLNEVSCKHRRLELCIQTSSHYHNEDWFVNLLRVAA